MHIKTRHKTPQTNGQLHIPEQPQEFVPGRARERGEEFYMKPEISKEEKEMKDSERKDERKVDLSDREPKVKQSKDNDQGEFEMTEMTDVKDVKDVKDEINLRDKKKPEDNIDE